MGRRKKYAFVIRKESGSYIAEVIRRRTAKGTKVERSRTFQTSEEASAWATAELESYLATRRRRAKRKKRHPVRAARKGQEAWLATQSLQTLAQLFQGNAELAEGARQTLKSKGELLWRAVGFAVLRNGASDFVAMSIADETVGKNWTQRLEKALEGELDRLDQAMSEMAVERAKQLRDLGRAQLDGRKGDHSGAG